MFENFLYSYVKTYFLQNLEEIFLVDKTEWEF